MRKILKLLILPTLMITLSGCCFSVGSIVIGKDCNKKMYCSETTVNSEFDGSINSDYSQAYKEAVKGVVSIQASTTTGSSTSSSVGSGVIFKEDLGYVYIATNRHVISTSTSSYTVAHSKFEVTFFDYTKKTATLIGAAVGIDVAVLKVSKVNLTSGENYKLISSASAFKDVEIGNNVFAIGTPISYAHAFSTSYGAVSNLFNTRVETSVNLGSYFPIQIDAAVNPGNSGGGLFNLEGKLIGMVQGGRTASDSDTTTTTGINYAIPIDTVINVANQLINTGTNTTYNIGLPKDGLTPISSISSKSSLGISEDEKEGLYLGINPRITSPLYGSGLSAGFIILTINDIEVSNMGILEMLEKSFDVGTVVTLKGHYASSPAEEVTYSFTIE